ncbi:MAG: hypothetical protein ACYC8T_16285 [Myxococcaceae bacterium]
MDEGANRPPMCPEHPEAAVAGTCARCGRFCCGACLEDGGLCPDCLQSAGRATAERRVFLQLRGLALSELVRAVLIFGLVFVARSSIAPEDQRLFYMAALVTALPFLGLAVAIWTSGRAWLSWLALALDVVVFGGMAFKASAQPLVVLALLALPVGMAIRVVRLQRLSRALAAPSPRAS